jgi:hypothetical protein
MSFVYGATGSTTLDAIPPAMANGPDPLMMLGMGLLLAGLGFKIAAFPFHMWAPDTYEAASTPFVAVALGGAEGRRLRRHHRLYVEGVGPSARLAAGRFRARRHDHRHRQPDGDPAAEHQADARLLGDRAHRLHAGGLAALSSSASR